MSAKIVWEGESLLMIPRGWSSTNFLRSKSLKKGCQIQFSSMQECEQATASSSVNHNLNWQ